MKISVINPNNLGEVLKEKEYGSITELLTGVCTETWSPGHFDPTRRRTNFCWQGADLLVLDIDNGCLLQDAKKIFTEYTCGIATTKSHGLVKGGFATDRFRVIIPFSEPITSPEDYAATWQTALARWPFIDKQCKDPARFYWPCKEVYYLEEQGLPYPVTHAPRTLVPEVTRAPRTIPTKLGKLSRATLTFLVEGAPPGEWNGALFKAAVDFNEQGYSFEETMQRFAQMINPFFSGSLDESDVKTITSGFNREPRYEPREAQVTRYLEIEFPEVIIAQDGRSYVHRSHPDNMRHLIQSYGYNPTWNELKNRIDLVEKPFDDGDFAILSNYSRAHGLRGTKDFIMEVLIQVSRENRFHPFKAAVESSQWDGRDHIADLFTTLTINPEFGHNNDWYFQFLRRWLIGALARIYNPGSQNMLLVLKGRQAAGKSRWIERLGIVPGIFAEGPVDPSNKDHQLRHLEYNFWHIPELDGITSKREAAELKSYLTQTEVATRKAYGRFDTQGKSQLSFVASINETSFLKDLTGNRRYLIIEVNAVNPKHEVQMQQVFAQAKVLWEQGEPYWFTEEESRQIDELNMYYVQDDFVGEIVQAVEPGEKRMRIAQFFQNAGHDRPSAGECARLANLLRKKGVRAERAGSTTYWLVKDRAERVLPRVEEGK